MKYLQVVSLAVLALATSTAISNAQACGPRIRRNWDAMSESEKTTYKGAVAAAMDSGAYIKFVEMHTEMQSEMEAHKQCMFIYWHRLFLVVFENMLRGQGAEFACVTIPYYNWMEASNKALTGECKTLGECSPIMKELGGFSFSSKKTVVINGVKVSGSCEAGAPLNHFCQSSSATGAGCARCLPRGDWSLAKVPASISYASVIGQVFNGSNIANVSRSLERGCHADIHATLGSTMAKFQSPADPIFWSHHAMLDALLTIFHKCRVGTHRMTFEEKAADPVAWASCKRRVGNRATGVPFKPTDVVTMRTGENGTNPVEGSEDPVIGKYFEGVPNRFADLLDVSDLGTNSYTYEISGLLATMYNDCGGMKVTPAATTASPTAVTSVPKPATNAPTTKTPAPIETPESTTTTPPSKEKRAKSIRGFFDWLYENMFPKTPAVRRRLASCRTATTKKKVAEKTMPPASSGSTHGEDRAPVLIATNLTRSEKKVINWYKEAVASHGGQSLESIADVERQLCMFQDQCLGGIIDFSEEFRSLWGVQEPRCRTIINAINSGEQEILDPAWQEKMEQHFGCPSPAFDSMSTKLSSTLSLGLLALAALQTPTEAQDSCGPRVRRNWNALSDSDKATYKGAIAFAMDSGAYIKFGEIHQENMSRFEAHGQCMFIYWHRYFLVAFENMLRAQGNEFACVTLPYFNWVDANSRQMDGKCSSLENCAAITSELGGSTRGSTQTVTINSVEVPGTCVEEWPLDHFCQSSAPGTDCSGCVPRGDWGSTAMPPETGLSNVRSEVFGSRSIGGMSLSVEGNSHGSVHNALSGAMRFLASPADPIFWSHHSMVDALHTIFHKCRVGTQRMSFEEKAANEVAWTSCSRVDKDGSTGVPFNPSDAVTVRTGSNTNSTNAHEDPVVSKFFEDVPNRFADLMDVRDLGDFSYSYELSGQLASMYTECDGTSPPSTTAPAATTRAPAPTTNVPEPTTAAPLPTTRIPEPTSTNVPEPTLSTTTSVPVTASPSTPSAPPATAPAATDNLANNQQLEDARRFFEWLWGNVFPNNTRSFRKLAAEGGVDNADSTKQQVDSKTPAPSKGPYDDGKVDVIIIDECGESEQRVMTWYKETTTAMGGMSADTIADLERQSCMYYDQCLGGVTDFSDEFKATWGIKEARCKTVVDAVKCGAQPIVYSKWREDMEAHFGCPRPAKASTQAPSNQDQTIQSDQTHEQQQIGDGNIAQAITGAIDQLTQSA